MLEIAIGSRINRRVAESLRITGQDNFLSGGAFSRKDYGDGGNGGFLRSSRQPRFGHRARMGARVNHQSENGERGRRDKDCGSPAGRPPASGTPCPPSPPLCLPPSSTRPTPPPLPPPRPSV